MDDYFDTSGVFEISKFDISKLACIDKMAYMRTLTFFQACLNKKMLCLFYDSAYTDRSTPTTAFDGAIRQHVVYTMLTH